MATLDTSVSCLRCSTKKDVNFEECLVSGWPECCGSTMHLEETTCDIREATTDAVDDQIPPTTPSFIQDIIFGKEGLAG